MPEPTESCRVAIVFSFPPSALKRYCFSLVSVGHATESGLPRAISPCTRSRVPQTRRSVDPAFAFAPSLRTYVNSSARL